MTPSLRITRRAADRLRAGHLWVYRSDLAPSASDTPDALTPGSLATVLDPAGRPLGSALYSSTSEIALRLVSPDPDLSREGFQILLRQRLFNAIARRRDTAPLSQEATSATTAQRLVFAEADNLPGLIADRYGSLVLVQLLTQGTAQNDVRHLLAELLPAALDCPNGPLTIWERPDPRIRKLEDLPPPPDGPLLHLGEGAPASNTTFALNGLHFGYDATAGQKTGAFLDQRLNYAAAAEWVRLSGRRGHALDVCTYQGGFALHLARVCGHVTGIDQSRAALEAAEANLHRNSTLAAQVDWIEADAFAFLRALDDSSPRTRTPEAKAQPSRSPDRMGLPATFDAIVLDPPAFAKSRRATEGALRGYKELNLRALRLLSPGGTLITCSCSHHVSAEDFREVLTAAALDAHRRVQVLEARGAAPDHPEVLTLPETRYLKCLICRVE